MRYLSLWLENWGIEAGIGRRSPDIGRPARPLAAYARIGNVHRLVAVNAPARRLGIVPGLTLAEARARHPSLEALEQDPAAAAARLAALTAWCRRFTPLAACDAPDGVMLDITGAAHLFGGEAGLAREIETRLAAQGLTGRAAIAATPEAAWALARFSPYKVAPASDEKSMARLVEPLPLAALHLDPEIIAALAQSGLRRIGDIAWRSRGPLTARFGQTLFHRLDALMGRTKSPISPLLEAPAYLAERGFAEGIVSRADVEATILSLAKDLAGLLERHAEGARRLAVHCFRVDGIVKEIAVGTSRPLADPQAIVRLFHERIEAVSAAEGSDDPLDAGYGFDVLQLAAYAVEPLPRVQQKWTPVLRSDTRPDEDRVQQKWTPVLRSDTRHDRQSNQLGFADPDRESEVLLADLVDRLGARLGVKRTRRLLPNDTHIPESAVVAVPAAELRRPSPRGWPRSGRVRGYGAGQQSSHAAYTSTPKIITPHPPPPAAPSPSGRGFELPARPIRLFAKPERIEAIAQVPDGPPLRFRWRRVMHEIASYEGPERIAPEWWKKQKGALSRDYFRVEDTQGQRFWLFRAGLYGAMTEDTESGGNGTEPPTSDSHLRWYMHGLFA
jgi:protein ImuB